MRTTIYMILILVVFSCSYSKTNLNDKFHSGQIRINIPELNETYLKSKIEFDVAYLKSDKDSKFLIPGTAYFKITDFDFKKNYYLCIADEGVYINDYVTTLKSKSQTPTLLSRVQFVEKSYNDLLNERKGNYEKGIDGEYFVFSSIPNQLDLIKAYEKAYNKKYDVLEWIKFAFLDLDKYSFKKLLSNLSKGDLEFEFQKDPSNPLFKFSNNGYSAKFGVKKFQINKFGEVIPNSTKYGIFEYELKQNKWERITKTAFENEIPDNFEELMGFGLKIRFVIYVLTFWFAYRFVSYIVKNFVSLFKISHTTGH